MHIVVAARTSARCEQTDGIHCSHAASTDGRTLKSISTSVGSWPQAGPVHRPQNEAGVRQLAVAS